MSKHILPLCFNGLICQNLVAGSIYAERGLTQKRKAILNDNIKIVKNEKSQCRYKNSVLNSYALNF